MILGHPQNSARFYDHVEMKLAKYYHDNVGNRLLEKREWSGYSKGDYHTYDDIYRLTGTKYEVPGTELDAFETYGIIPTTYVKYQDFTMDDVGNRTAFNDDGTSHGYIINEMNEYSQIDSTSRTYDSNGNLTDDGTLEYNWDFANRLVAAYDSTTNNLVESYTHDARGRRITKYSAPTTQGIVYVHDGDQILETRDASDDSLRSRFVYGIGIDEPVEKENNGNKYYYHLNSLGSVVAMTDANGAVYERYEYDAYGKPTIWNADRSSTRSDSLCQNQIMFTGRWFDKATGLYYYRARMYSPQEGRFLSHDSLEYLDHMALYIYAGNNPIYYIDSYGNQEAVAVAEPKKLGLDECKKLLGDYNMPDTLVKYREYFKSKPELNSMLEKLEKIEWSKGMSAKQQSQEAGVNEKVKCSIRFSCKCCGDTDNTLASLENTTLPRNNQDPYPTDNGIS